MDNAQTATGGLILRCWGALAAWDCEKVVAGCARTLAVSRRDGQFDARGGTACLRLQRVCLQRVPFSAAHPTPFRRGDFKKAAKAPKLRPAYQQQYRPTKKFAVGDVIFTCALLTGQLCKVGRNLPRPSGVASRRYSCGRAAPIVSEPYGDLIATWEAFGTIGDAN